MGRFFYYPWYSSVGGCFVLRVKLTTKTMSLSVLVESRFIWQICTDDDQDRITNSGTFSHPGNVENLFSQTWDTQKRANKRHKVWLKIFHFISFACHLVRQCHAGFWRYYWSQTTSFSFRRPHFFLISLIFLGIDKNRGEIDQSTPQITYLIGKKKSAKSD